MGEPLDRLLVRLFHLSDTHLGHQQYPRTNAEGLNAREQDLYDAFHRVVDLAVAERPDLVVHAGDLFDGVRPGNRALACAMEGFLKLSRAGIPTLVIAGNHEQPRMRETGSPLRLFAHLPHVHVAFEGRRRSVDVATRSGPWRVHLVPQCSDNEALAQEVQEAPLHGNDLLVLHGSLASLPAFAHAEFNEQRLEPHWFAPFRYVALGHYHGVQQVAPNAWYSGATERVSIAEAGQEKGFLDVRIDAAARATFRPVPGRPYADLPAIDCTALSGAAVQEAAIAAVARAPAGAVARLRLERIEPLLRASLDLRLLRQAAAHLLHLDLRIEWADLAQPVRADRAFRGLAEEFEAFLARQPLEGVERDQVLAAAREVVR
jgi:DNA repair protein SbcD/Mre11